MALDDWPEPDRDWAGRYLLGLFREGVEASASSERQAELIAAVHAAGVPAEELFGDPADVARADAPDLAGPSAVAAAESADRAGARDAVGYAGAALLLLGVIAAIMVLVSGDGPIDVRVGVVAVLLAIIGGMIAGSVALFHSMAGRLRAAALAGAVAVGVVLVGGSQVTWSGRDVVLIADLPRWAAALGLLLPGVLAILTARLVPARAAQTAWDDDAWFDRFRGVLTTKGVPAGVAREHERTLREGLAGTTAMQEYGRPDAFALTLAADDPAAPGRRLWWGAAGWFALAVLQAAFIPDDHGFWLLLRVVLIALLIWLGVRSALRARRARPAAPSPKAVQ